MVGASAEADLQGYIRAKCNYLEKAFKWPHNCSDRKMLQAVVRPKATAGINGESPFK
jgi:hypothetical protein